MIPLKIVLTLKQLHRLFKMTLMMSHCAMQPTCVHKNTLFVVDLKKLRNPKDVTCDDMGSWRSNGIHPAYVVQGKSGVIFTLSFKKLTGESIVVICTRHYYHKTANNLNKIFSMTDNVIMVDTIHKNLINNAKIGAKTLSVLCEVNAILLCFSN